MIITAGGNPHADLVSGSSNDGEQGTFTANRTKREIDQGEARPVAPEVKPDGIPQELRQCWQWVCWRYEWKEDKEHKGRWTKVPLNARTGCPASTTDTGTWASFDEALASYQRNRKKADGIGFVFAAEDPFCGIDLDDGIDPATGQLHDWAAEIVAELKSYTEISPSRTGVKIWVNAGCPGEKHAQRFGTGKVELYYQGRYFTVTGHNLSGTSGQVENRQRELQEVYDRVFAPTQQRPNHDKTVPEEDHPGPGTGLTDDDLVREMFNSKRGARIRALWDGDTSAYGGDDSSADLALCNYLAWWTNCDPVRTDRLFRRSRLLRDKWDERRGNTTYGEMTIAKAINGCDGGYTGPRPSANRTGEHADATQPAPQPEEQPHLTDRGNAMRLAREHGEKLRYCYKWRKWLVWDGCRWQEDQTGEVDRCAKKTVLGLYRWARQRLARLEQRGTNRSEDTAV